MSGLFEDDRNVRKYPKLPIQKKAKDLQKKIVLVDSNQIDMSNVVLKKKNDGDKFLDKLNPSVDLASIASHKRSSQISFENVNLQTIKKKQNEKEEVGKLIPMIDYIGDFNVSET